MSEWVNRAACARHENPELWCRQNADDIAADARYICLARCKVRLECGEWALRNGERDVVAGGYRTWDDSDMQLLREELPHVDALHVKRTRRTYECNDCAAQFTSTRSSDQCMYCRKGLVPAEPVREWIRTLLRSGLRTQQIGELAGRKPNTISGIMAKSNPPQWVRASTAQCILAIELPVQAVSA